MRGLPLGAAMRRAAYIVVALGAFLALTPESEAYVGPGAGFALVSSFLVVFVSFLLAALAMLTWPFRALWRFVRRRRMAKPWIRRLIIIGFDGQEPSVTDRLLEEGKLPNFKRLAEMGCYHRIGTSHPPISPVAWSCFSTGTGPGKHNIFDFLDRDPRNYLPLLSSTYIGKVDKVIKLGRYRFPLRKPEIRLLRKSKPFWTILGERGIWSTVLRVPITFPPDKFYGAQLSAMCVPDLLGTQGTFLHYTTRPAESEIKEGGIRIRLDSGTDRFETKISGPENTLIADHPPMEIPLIIDLDRAARRAKFKVGQEQLELAEGELSDFVKLSFRAAPMVTVSGLCRMMITEMGEHFSLYISPLGIDPDSPAMPISHPSYYATYLSKKVGPYVTLGLAEDTWSLDEEVVDDGTFLKQALDIDDERRRMFFAALEKLRRGSLTCIFDATDRIQHMFWRYLDEDHPAGKNREQAEHRDAIVDLYQRNDAMLGEVFKKLRKNDVLVVMSDHGFCTFRRGVNLNRWLLDNGYLALKPDADGKGDWLSDVDWSRTQVYGMGLAGMFLNLKGRESQGIVEPGDQAQRIKDEIVAKMSGLVDEEKGEVAINEVFDAMKTYKGPYRGNAPDLLVGYRRGYRVGWDCASGIVAGPLFEDNLKAWSGDHCIDPSLIPGVVFSTHKMIHDDPNLVDLAPTALRLFGVEPPAHMDGKALFDKESVQSPPFGSGQ